MISANNVSLLFSGEALFEDVNISFTEGNCYGVIGANGAGKSTFLKLLSGDIEPSSGHISIQPGKRLSFLRQDHFEYDQFSVLETVIMGNDDLYKIMKEKDAIYSKADFTEADGIRAGELEEAFADMDGWNAESDAAILLNGLGVTTDVHDLKMHEVDAKDKVKVLLAQALFGNPDILLLDEPTNHLDLEAIQWLEEFIMDLKSTVILVSHDRAFLNKVCTYIADVDFQKIQLFVGNYDFWYESSQLLLRQMKDSNKKKEEKLKELQEFVDRFSANASKSKQATSRKQQMERIQLDDIKPSNRKYPFIEFKPKRTLGQSVLECDQVSYGSLIKNMSFTIGNGEKVAIVSEDERLQSAFFDLISGTIQPDSGTVHWGASVEKGYFNKNFEADFDTNERIVDWLMQYSDEKDESFVRGFLGRMIFTGEDALKSLNVLSGGEKVRCMMSRLMLEGPNVLLLDEPTNHLDLESITALNNALIKYPGTLIIASHDFQIISSTVDRVIELNSDGTYRSILGDYEHYLSTKA